jgi:aminoglycoside phosphotransferase
MPTIAKSNTVITSTEVECRWTVSATGDLVQKPGQEGVVGLFLFGDPLLLPEIPETGEFVEFLSSVPSLNTTRIGGIREVGTQEALAKLSKNPPSRFFNRITITGNVVEKKCVVPAFERLLAFETAWYSKVGSLGYEHLPRVFGENPLTMEKIEGVHPHELPGSARPAVLESIIEALSDLHELGTKEAVREARVMEYFEKTRARLKRVRGLLPWLSLPTVRVNGRITRNMLTDQGFEELEQLLVEIDGDFAIIHGDPTFSNTLITRNGTVMFIDPRGYFGESEIYGDPIYDWAKLYYSVVGGYDAFNARRFDVVFDERGIDVALPENPWRELGQLIVDASGVDSSTLQAVHGLIWASLTGYILDDSDAVVAAFALALSFLEEALS